MGIQRNDIFFTLGLITALWFALTSYIWAYWAAVVISYPFGIISYFLWQKIRHENRQRTLIIPIILGIGLFASVAMLLGLLILG